MCYNIKIFTYKSTLPHTLELYFCFCALNDLEIIYLKIILKLPILD
jgi:hypothetical protein